MLKPNFPKISGHKISGRRIWALGAMTAMAVTLAACEPEDYQQAQSSSLLSEAGVSPGWSMTDLAGIDPAFLGGSYADLPQALPMQASWDGGYGYAPSYDYAPAYEDQYYAPLDESYYAEPSGSDDYLWIALAAALAGMLGDSPPDYAFGYGEIQPWAWETSDHYIRYAEPVHDGYRYYYYEPDAYRPFLVRDPYYSYGYREDRLVVIYDRYGRIIDAGRADRQRLAARSYYARGQDLYRAGHRHDRFGVPARLWDDRRHHIERERREWREARRDREEWRRWDARHQQRLHRDWGGEALVRRKAERSFADWQKVDYRTPAPRFYTAEKRRAQLDKVAELRREQAKDRRREQRREEQFALAERLGREQRDRIDRRSGERPQLRKASLVAERDDRREERAQLRAQRQAEVHRAEDRSRPKAKAVERREDRQRQQAERQSQRREQQARQERQQRQQAQRENRQKQQAERQSQRREQQARQERQQRQQAQRESRQKQQAERQSQLREQQARQQRQQAQRENRQKQQAERQSQRREQQARQERQQRQQAQRENRQKQQAERRSQRREQQARQERQQRQQAQRENRQKQQAERQSQRREQQARQERQQRQQAQRESRQKLQAERQSQRREQQARQERQQRQQAQRESRQKQQAERRQQQSRQQAEQRQAQRQQARAQRQQERGNGRGRKDG